jgi:hypothetical protein
VTTSKADAAREAAAQLEALAVDLGGRDFETCMLAGHRLNVVSLAAPEIREDVSAAPAEDGKWWFRWSWGDRIAPVTDVETAAFKIAYVLTPIQM